MYQYIALKDLRPRLPQVVNRVDRKLDRFIVSRHGKPVAVFLALDDFESLLETLNETEDRANLARIRRGLNEARRGRTVSWKHVKKRLGI